MAKILYVEDNEDNVYMLASRLKRKGHEVIVATDGRQGVALALAEAPALILMDLSLPVVDDWEATRRLKALPETRDIPVIAISAHAMASDRDSAIRVGCDDFDTKPIQFDRLLRKIEQLLPRSRDDERCRT
jgi:two-component system cell cycle response regulator DivK